MSNGSCRLTLTIGLALFSMFFGSGNLIFPLAVGKVVGDHFWAGALGFVMTAVLVPFLGIAAMIVFRGDYRAFFARFGERTGFMLTLVILCLWIPLGSGPRCAVLAHAALRDDLPQMSLAFFVSIYCLLTFLLAWKRAAVIDLLGVGLTPLLLIALGGVVYLGAFADGVNAPLSGTSSLSIALSTGVIEGYNTMDLVASFFFSSTLISMLESREGLDRAATQVAWSGMVAICLLTTVYVGLMYVANIHSDQLIDVSKDRLLPLLAGKVLGPTFGLVTSVAIALACMTTSIALTTVFTDFLHVVSGGKFTRAWCLAFVSLITFLMAWSGFENISALSGPAFQVLYPLLIVLIVVNLVLVVRARRRERRPS